MITRMDFKKFSKKEMVDILDIIHDAALCPSEQCLIKVIGRIRAFLCADSAACALSVTGSANIDGLLKIINIGHPLEWLKVYASLKLYERDPVMRSVFETSRAHLWREAEERYPYEPYKGFLAMGSDFGLRYGLASGTGGPSGKASFFSFAGESRHFTDYHKELLEIFTPHLHQAFIRTSGAREKERAPLSEREREVLKWMKEGKTNWEISVILNISERTVKFHVQNIEWKLNAVNKAHAIAIALGEEI